MPVMTRRARVRRARRFARRRARYYRRGRFFRSITNPQPTFTETVALPPLSIAGSTFAVGQVGVRCSLIPDWASYRNLYNQHRINKVTLILIPAFTQTDAEWGSAALPAPRFAFALQDTNGAPAPTQESDVLADNGSKVYLTHRPIKIHWRPVPQYEVTANGGPNYNPTTRTTFFSTNDDVTYGFMAWSIQMALNLPPGNSGAVYSVYAKINFTLRDPK